LHVLGLSDHNDINKKTNNLELEATKHQFIALITDSENKTTWIINQEGFVHQLIAYSNE
jgi:hypothetical protein